MRRTPGSLYLSSAAALAVVLSACPKEGSGDLSSSKEPVDAAVHPPSTAPVVQDTTPVRDAGSPTSQRIGDVEISRRDGFVVLIAPASRLRPASVTSTFADLPSQAGLAACVPGGGTETGELERKTAGLLVIQGRRLHFPAPLSEKRPSTLGAFLVVDGRGNARITAEKDFDITAISHGLEAGPVLVEDGAAVADLPTETAPGGGSAVAILPDSRVAIVTTAEPTSLEALARFLVTLGAQRAMALHGGAPSALAVARDEQGWSFGTPSVPNALCFDSER